MEDEFASVGDNNGSSRLRTRIRDNSSKSPRSPIESLKDMLRHLKKKIPEIQPPHLSSLSSEDEGSTDEDVILTNEKTK
jgi:hypothetical protein